MTAQKYKDYELAVGRFCRSNNIRPGCYGPNTTEDGDTPEPFFSWRQCGCCGSRLGGNRETYTFETEDDHKFTENICADCVYYLAYGQLDDLTMLEIAETV